MTSGLECHNISLSRRDVPCLICDVSSILFEKIYNLVIMLRSLYIVFDVTTSSPSSCGTSLGCNTPSDLVLLIIFLG